MNLINTIEALCGRVFNIMALLRTLVCIIFLIFSLCACGAVENVYSEAYWIQHKLHFQDDESIPNCHWCREYNRQIP